MHLCLVRKLYTPRPGQPTEGGALSRADYQSVPTHHAWYLPQEGGVEGKKYHEGWLPFTQETQEHTE